MLEPLEIAEAVTALAGTDGPLSGVSLMITAGPTREPVDPVRFISNRSSGKMGFALAEQAAQMGARVMLVSGPVSLVTPPGVQRVDVETAEQMHQAVHDNIAGVDIFVGAAAVSDYRVAEQADHKIKKTSEHLSLELVRNPDILAWVSSLEPGKRPFTVGFAAETENLEDYARGKLSAKSLDLIAANLVGEGRAFDKDTNALVAYWPEGAEDLGSGSKVELARLLLNLIARHFRNEDA